MNLGEGIGAEDEWAVGAAKRKHEGGRIILLLRSSVSSTSRTGLSRGKLCFDVDYAKRLSEGTNMVGNTEIPLIDLGQIKGKRRGSREVIKAMSAMSIYFLL